MKQDVNYDFNVVVEGHRVPICNIRLMQVSPVLEVKLNSLVNNEFTLENISYQAFKFIAVPVMKRCDAVVVKDIDLKLLLEVHRFAVKYEMKLMAKSLQNYINKFVPKNLQEICILSLRRNSDLYEHYIN